MYTTRQAQYKQPALLAAEPICRKQECVSGFWAVQHFIDQGNYGQSLMLTKQAAAFWHSPQGWLTTVCCQLPYSHHTLNNWCKAVLHCESYTAASSNDPHNSSSSSLGQDSQCTWPRNRLLGQCKSTQRNTAAILHQMWCHVQHFSQINKAQQQIIGTDCWVSRQLSPWPCNA